MKLPALTAAHVGRFDHLDAVWIGAPRHVDFLDEQIASLTDTIGEQIGPLSRGPLSCC